MNNQYASIKYLRMSNIIGFVWISIQVREERSILILLRLKIHCCSRLAEPSTNSNHNTSTGFYEESAKIYPPSPTHLSCYGSFGSIDPDLSTSNYDIFGQSAGSRPSDRGFSPSCGMHRWAACMGWQSAEVYWRSTIFSTKMSRFPNISKS